MWLRSMPRTQRVWRFNTIPGLGEFGHETWPQNSDVWKAGGGGMWMTPAVDLDLGLVYFGVGNALPQLGGELRAETIYSTRP